MIKYVETKDKKLPINYGMNALANYSELRGVSINDALNLDMSKMNLMDYFTLIYVGVKDGARVAKVDCEFASIDEFLDYADENKNVVSEIADIFADYGKGGGDSKKK